MRIKVTSIGFLVATALALASQAQQARSLKPPAASPPSDRAIDAMTQAGRGHEAARSLEEYARQMPEDKITKARAARLYESLGDLTAAKTAAQEAASGDSPDPQAIAVLARLAAREENWSEAVSLGRQLVLMTPNDPSAHLAYGNALSRVGDSIGANNEYARYRELQGMKPVPAETAHK